MVVDVLKLRGVFSFFLVELGELGLSLVLDDFLKVGAGDSVAHFLFDLISSDAKGIGAIFSFLRTGG